MKPLNTFLGTRGSNAGWLSAQKAEVRLYLTIARTAERTREFEQI